MDDTRTLIQTVWKGSTPMQEYLREKKNWSDILALTSDPYPEAHLVANMLSGLDAEYLSIMNFNGGGRFSGSQGSLGRSLGRGRINGPRPTCQVCGNDNLFADSGASNHITSEASNQNQKQEYNGKETVVVSNGNKSMAIHNTSWSSLHMSFDDLPTSPNPTNHSQHPAKAHPDLATPTTLSYFTSLGLGLAREQPHDFENFDNFQPIPATIPIPITHPMVTQAKVGIFNPHILPSQIKVDALNTTELDSVEAALQHPGWNKSMDTERNKTWDLLPPSPL
uniref:Uncharacterized protein n=1 Tax=Cannabis sativa TaxID=3483 RepID=A0A803NZ94_CANSA